MKCSRVGHLNLQASYDKAAVYLHVFTKIS